MSVAVLLYVLGAESWYRLTRSAQFDAEEMPSKPHLRAAIAGIAWPLLAMIIVITGDDPMDPDAD